MWKCITWVAVASLIFSGAGLGGVCCVAEEKESPFVVWGKVVDDGGKPLAGVEVHASCGIGTLFQTGTAKTDGEGKYRLAFGPGIRMAAGTKLGVGTQCATITPRLKGWYEVHLGRRGNLLMSEAKDQLSSEDFSGYAGVVGANEPYELNFTMARAAAVEGRLVTEFGSGVPGVKIGLTGDILPPSSSVLASVKTDDEGRFAFESVPVWLADPSIKLKWRFTIRPFGVRHELESSSFEVVAGQVSNQKLMLESSGERGEVRLGLKRQGGAGNR